MKISACGWISASTNSDYNPNLLVSYKLQDLSKNDMNDQKSEWTTLGHLVFMFWNTSLSPPKKGMEPPTDEERDFVVAQINWLRARYEFDILGLCEVNTNDLDYIYQRLDDKNLRVIDTTKTIKNSIHDTSLIINQLSIEINQDPLYLGGTLDELSRAGTKISFCAYGTFFGNIVVSHWPSRMQGDQAEISRTKLAMAIAEDYKSQTKEEDNPNYILMGDYNDDPFSTSLTEYLLATRDKKLAAKPTKLMFYNPFWKCLGEVKPTIHLSNTNSICGSYFYKSGRNTRWHTFDQIIFSRSFIEDGPMELLEADTKVISNENLNQRIESRSPLPKNDHLPVLCRVVLRRKS